MNNEQFKKFENRIEYNFKDYEFDLDKNYKK